MVNHHFAPPFGRIFIHYFQSSQANPRMSKPESQSQNKASLSSKIQDVGVLEILAAYFQIDQLVTGDW